jgi:hypothetical protein
LGYEYGEDDEAPDPTEQDNTPGGVSDMGWFGNDSTGRWGFDRYSRGEPVRVHDEMEEEEPEMIDTQTGEVYPFPPYPHSPGRAA